MNQLNTTGIILTRTDFGEADRIITLLTPDHGKLRLLARGVRRVKSKLAGGIELFSVSHITFVRGRGEIGTLVSARLIRHYGKIVGSLDRTMLGYELIKQLNKATEDEPEPDYFDLLQQTFEALDAPHIPTALIRVWFAAQMLRLGGHAPNLHSDARGTKLESDQTYGFDLPAMAFAPASASASSAGHRSQFGASHIKFLRLLFAGNQPAALAAVQGVDELTAALTPLVGGMVNTHLHG